MSARSRVAPSHRIFAVGAAASIASGALLLLIPAIFGSPRYIVQVAWRSVDDDRRRRLEQQFALSEPAPIGPTGWAYVPLDTNVQRLRALIDHPAVAATDGIDRRQATISRSASLTARRGGLVAAPPWWSQGTKLVAWLLLVVGVAAVVGSGAIRTGWDPAPTGAWLRGAAADPRRAFRAAWRAVGVFLFRGVPVSSPRAAGVFRIVFGALVLAFVYSEPAGGRVMTAEGLAAAEGPYGTVVRALARIPSAGAAIDTGLAVFGLLFIAGLGTRISFAAFVGTFLLWVCVFTVDTSLHAVSALSITLLCLTGSPWGDAVSVDALLRRGAGHQPAQPSKRYGFVMWVPGFVFGVAFAAAAWAKIGGGPEWVLNGTVRYHFLTDLDQAWVQWGPQLTRHDVTAVAMSGGAVLIEALTITAAFVRSDAYRVAAGVGAFVLLTGFALFQGVVWMGWWILLTGFLPWHLIGSARSDAARPTGPTRAQAAAVWAVVVQQGCASAFALDLRPLVSVYDMYATTQRPGDTDNAPGRVLYRVVADTPDGWRDLPGCVLDAPDAAILEAALDGWSDAVRPLDNSLTICLAAARHASRVRLDIDREVYDWSQGRLIWKRRVDLVGPIAVGH